jgi:pimeloyl-ACP methyl ester carboxylesterase
MLSNTLYNGREWNVDPDKRVKISNAELRYTVPGSGRAGSLHSRHQHRGQPDHAAPGLLSPLFENYRLITYYRAGYNGSTLEKSTLSIEKGAEHARQLLDHLGIDKAHIMAFSFGGVIAFQFLLSYPERAHSAILLEPYLPREAPDAVQANIDAFNRANEIYQRGDKLGAAQCYMELVCGPTFLGAVEMTNPLDVWRRVEECVNTTFTVDFAAITNWGFRMSQADSLVSRKPGMPVLAAMGLDSESAMPSFRETQRFLMSWLPQAERCGIMNATHGMQSMNPVAVGGAHAFLKKHPMRWGAEAGGTSKGRQECPTALRTTW